MNQESRLYHGGAADKRENEEMMRLIDSWTSSQKGNSCVILTTVTSIDHLHVGEAIR